MRIEMHGKKATAMEENGEKTPECVRDGRSFEREDGYGKGLAFSTKASKGELRARCAHSR
jgi:hypothetical protein